MLRVSLFVLLLIQTLALTAAPAFAHEGAGIVHYLTHADHVAALIVTIALPVLFWMVWRAKRPEPQKQPIRRNRRQDR
jgi:hypothetical protein